MGESDRGTVLIVDDEPDIIDLFETILAPNWNVQTASTGSEGLSELNERTDIVLLDNGLPDISGKEVLVEMREREPDLKIVMVSGTEPTKDENLPYDEYIVKPIGPSELRELAKSLL